MKIQSYSDVITNSSTEVFVTAIDTDYLIDIINAVLAAAGSAYTCDDLFELTIEYGEYVLKAKGPASQREADRISMLLDHLFHYETYIT